MSNTLTDRQNNVQRISLMDIPSAVNFALSQYNYTLSYGDTERLKNLQPGQSMIVYATSGRHGALLEVTYHSDGTYSIRSTTPLNVGGQWVDINQIVRAPVATITYSNSGIQTVSTTNYSITGNIYLKESGSLNSTKLATYNINTNVPIISNITNTGITFNTGTPQTTVNLQAINVPVVTSQQLQSNTNLQPGWYYNPETREFIKLEYRTITQPQTQTNVNNQVIGYSSLPENRLWFGYSSAPITNTQNNINNQTVRTNPLIIQPQTQSSINNQIIDYSSAQNNINNQTKMIYFGMPPIGPAGVAGAAAAGATKIASAGNALRSFLSTPVVKELAKEYVKNVGGFTAFNLGINEAVSRVTTGSGLTPEQIKQIIGESVVFGTSFTTFAKGFSLTSQPILSTIVKQETSPTKAILTKSLYDVGSSFASGFGASLVSQGVSRAMGWREDINPYEALATGSLTGGTTAAIRGIQVIRASKTGNYDVFATRVIPERIEDAQLTPISATTIKDGSIITYQVGRAQGVPQIGQKVLTQKDIPNIKPIEYQYIATERIEPIISKTEIVGNRFITTMDYRGTYVAQAGVKRIVGETKGSVISITVPTEKIGPREYELFVREAYRDLVRRYPQFTQLKDVPREGLQLSKQILEGRPIRTIENPNVKTLDIYYPLSELYTGNVNFNRNIAGVTMFRSAGTIRFPKAERYEYAKEGIGLNYYSTENKNQLAQIATSWGIMRDQYKKGWYSVHQYVSVGSPGKGFNVFGYGKAVDPRVESLTLTKTIERVSNTRGMPINNQQINQLTEQSKQLLAYSTPKVVPPYYNPKAPPALGIPSLNIIDVNRQLLPNLENVVRPQIDLERLKEKVTQTIPKPQLDVTQTIQNVRQRVAIPTPELRSLQLHELQTQQQSDLQRIIAQDRIVTYGISRITTPTPYVTTKVETASRTPSPSPNISPQIARPQVMPIPPPGPKMPFLPFLPLVAPRIGPSQPGPPIPLGNARRIEWDIAYTFKRIWK